MFANEPHAVIYEISYVRIGKEWRTCQTFMIRIPPFQESNMFSKIYRIIWVSLIAMTFGASAGIAETTIWESNNGYARSFGFDILETNASGQDMVLVTVDPSSSDNWVDVYQVGPGQGTSSIMSIYEPVSIAHKRAFGHDVGSVGDVNGDGYDDFVICAALTCSCYEPDEQAGFYVLRDHRHPAAQQPHRSGRIIVQ